VSIATPSGITGESESSSPAIYRMPQSPCRLVFTRIYTRRPYHATVWYLCWWFACRTSCS